jgi:Neu-associated kinase
MFLRDLFLFRKQLDENETRKYIRQIVSAVDHMHRGHVIHRDIKLQNFMLDQNNDIVIIGKEEYF